MTHRHVQVGRDAGFSLVELLVALAISSLIVVGIGGLFVYSGELRDRSEKASRIQAALIDLNVIASVLASSPQVHLEARGPGSFELLREQPQGSSVVEPSASVATVLVRDGEFSITYPASQEISSVDLSPFDKTAIEYLSFSAQTPVWLPADQIGTQAIRGVRLDLQERHRHWPLFLWIDDFRHASRLQ